MITTKTVKPTLEMLAIINNVEDFARLPCPYCNDRMWIVDNGNYPVEEYKGNGEFERTERYYCDNCCTYADVTSTYTRTPYRRVKVMQDVEELG